MTQPRERGIIPPQIKVNASQDGVRPNEYVRRVIQGAISLNHPLVGRDDPFVVIGVDAYDGQIYPCGSFQTAEGARSRVVELIEEEPLYSTHTSYGDGLTGITSNNTFRIFTRDGFVVPLQEPKPNKP